MGTGNLFAAALGLPRGPIHAARALATAGPRMVDFGMVVIDGSAEGFCVGVGAGMDARVMSAATPADKARLGVGAYFAAALRLLPRLKPAQTRVVIDGRHLEYRALATLVLNCGQMAGLPRPRFPVLPDDGWLDLVAVRGESSLRGLVGAGASALGAMFRNSESAKGPVIRLRGRNIAVDYRPGRADRGRRGCALGIRIVPCARTPGRPAGPGARDGVACAPAGGQIERTRIKEPPNTRCARRRRLSTWTESVKSVVSLMYAQRSAGVISVFVTSPAASVLSLTDDVPQSSG